jgi:DNA-binding XRE family transcriptional regulator
VANRDGVEPRASKRRGSTGGKGHNSHAVPADFPFQVGAAITRLRQERGLSAVELAERLGVFRTTVHAQERSPWIGPGLLMAYAAALGTTAEGLLEASKR